MGGVVSLTRVLWWIIWLQTMREDLHTLTSRKHLDSFRTFFSGAGGVRAHIGEKLVIIWQRFKALERVARLKSPKS